MKIGYLTLISALLISSVAIYFSVAGLAAIFSAYAISIIIMGTTIELGKLAGVVWLHYNWEESKRWLRTSIIILIMSVMFLTSMGIFGYLSKSHVEQTGASQEGVAQVQRVDSEIARNRAIIARSEEKIQSLSTNGSGVDVSLQMQIDKEQERINTAYKRVKDEIAALERKVSDAEKSTERRTMSYDVEVLSISKNLNELQEALSNKEIRKAQGIVGTKPDGIYGSQTVQVITAYRLLNNQRRAELLAKIDSIRATPSATMLNAQSELSRVRDRVQSEINESRKLINRLQARIGTSKAADIESLIVKQQDKVKESNVTLDTLIEEKFKLEANYRKLEAEVGPVKYIAEFVYGEKADQNLLERAVQWVIILIIVVFDPFAVLLLIAAQHSFDRAKKKRPKYQEPLTHDELPRHKLPKENIYNGRDGNGYQPITDELAPRDPPKSDGRLTEGKTRHAPKQDTGLKPIAPPPAPEVDIEKLDAEIDAVLKGTGDTVRLTKAGEQYINYNGKVYRNEALRQTFPDLKLDFESLVQHGNTLPDVHEAGSMFILTDHAPTLLYRSNGSDWDQIDKNLLEFSAYNSEYINHLIGKIGKGDYNSELLNECEKTHIEHTLTRDQN